MSGRKVELGIYVEHGKEARAAYAMDALKRSMRWDEEKFGREYDLDVFNIVAVSDFNMGAMENKGLNVFNDKYVLADEETATDADFANIEAVIAHEYFHNWTGNRITCRDWFQLCLKEGLTVFRDHEFSADQRSRAVKRIAEVRTLRAHQFPEDQGPLAHPVRPRRYREINNFYTSTVYEKGSEVVRMIRTILGAETFRKGMDLYFERHDGEAATVEDFLKVFEDVSGRDLAQFALWYHQAGTPNLTVTASLQPGGAELRLEIEQSVPPTPSESRKRLMHIPLAFGLVGKDGKDIDYGHVDGAAVENGVIHVRKRRHSRALQRRRGAAGAVAQPRLLDADHAVDRADAGRARLPGAPRQRPVLALAGVQLAAHRRADGRLAPVPRRQGAGILRTSSPSWPARSPPTRRWSRRSGRWRWRCRARPTSPASSAPTSIPTRSLPRARRWPRRSPTPMPRCSSGCSPELGGDNTFSPDAASAGRRALRNALLDYLSAGSGGPARAARQFAPPTT